MNYAISDTLNIQFDEYLQDKVRTTTGMFEAYQVTNLALLKRKAFNQFDFKLSVRNIFNDQYSYPSTSLNQGYPGEGRSFLLQLDYSFK